jgi:hypothetical protein
LHCGYGKATSQPATPKPHPEEIKLLEAKIETYRKRAKGAAIAKAGKVSYQLTAEC